MPYRPYPNVDRALRQVARHVQPAPVIPMTPALRGAVAFMEQMRLSARRVLEAHGVPVDEYRLSTR